MANKFFKMLEQRWNAGARICVGLDSDFEKIDDMAAPNFEGGLEDVLTFNKAIIRATKHIALAYKPNIAFYTGDLAAVLDETLHFIRHQAFDVPVILDSKRADIGNTNKGYVSEGFNFFGADAVTVNPYFGKEAMRPFLERDDKGIIVLCRTSNPGAGEFQDLIIDGAPMWPLYQQVAYNVKHLWNKNGNCALVVGATYPEQMAKVREIVGDDMWILAPGIGTQGGDLEKTVRAGVGRGKSRLIVNSSSGIIFASLGEDFAEAARCKLEQMTLEYNDILARL